MAAFVITSRCLDLRSHPFVLNIILLLAVCFPFLLILLSTLFAVGFLMLLNAMQFLSALKGYTSPSLRFFTPPLDYVFLHFKLDLHILSTSFSNPARCVILRFFASS